MDEQLIHDDEFEYEEFYEIDFDEGDGIGERINQEQVKTY